MDSEYKRLHYYKLSPAEVSEQLQSSLEGLSAAEAVSRLHEFGRNELEQPGGRETIAAFARQPLAPLALLLAVGAGIAFYLHDGKTAALLIIIALVNTIIGFRQGLKANRLLAKNLEPLLQYETKVLRDGKLTQIDPSELVLGDVVRVESGSVVPADLRIIKQSALAVNDYLLTDVDEPSRKFARTLPKSTPPEARNNLLFMGTPVTDGDGLGMVVATGRYTELAEAAAQSIRASGQASPTPEEMRDLSKRLAIVAAMMAAIPVLLSLFEVIDPRHALFFIVCIVAAVVPAGLAFESSLPVGIIKRRARSQNIISVVRSALTCNAAELLTVLLGLATLSLLSVPPAITTRQILAIDIITLILPVMALGWDKIQHRQTSEPLINRQTALRLTGFGGLAGLLSYANFAFFFVRHGLSARFLDTGLPLYAEATTLTFLSLVLCLCVHLVFERSDRREKFFTRYLWSNERLMGGFAASLILIINLLYNPWIQPYFGTTALSLGDWLSVLACTVLYFGFRLLQRHTRKHTRRAVVQLHRDLGLTRPVRH